jgi:hypothetical protein
MFLDFFNFVYSMKVLRQLSRKTGCVRIRHLDPPNRILDDVFFFDDFFCPI